MKKIEEITKKIEKEIEPEFKKMSRNKASTFFGFCDYHDTEVFKPIELVPYQNTPERHFLMATGGFV